MPLRGFEHGCLAAGILALLASCVGDHHLGAVVGIAGFLLKTGADAVRVPNVAFVRCDRVPARGTQRGYAQGAPDLAVYVGSLRSQAGVGPGSSSAQR
jgi:hypothetical protein